MLTSHTKRTIDLKKNRWSPAESKLILIACGIIWLLVGATGMMTIWGYENSPGIAGTPPGRWPADTQITRSTDRATLVMLAHPHCPCTRASIGELAFVMAHTQGRVKAYVLFLQPTDLPADRPKTDLLQSPAGIPGVSDIGDTDGIDARTFGALTSGQTILYDAEGRLLFNGGITGARGHAGDNPGRSSIVSLLTKDEAARKQTPVFGCPLVGTDPVPEEGNEACHTLN
jgi:hypothetical protein